MFEVYIEGGYRGSFNTAAEAMEYVERYARPYRSSWEIKDKYRQTYAKG